MAKQGQSGWRSISDQTVREATGKDWGAWFELLDSFDVAAHGHAATAKHLAEVHELPMWWAQTVTVHYEHENGLRQLGQSGKTWQLSLQRTFDVSADKLWRALQTGDDPMVGQQYALHDGIVGSVRRITKERFLRLTVEHEMDKASTLELDLAKKGKDRTALRLRHHGLGSQQAREAFRQRWSDGLTRLQGRIH